MQLCRQNRIVYFLQSQEEVLPLALLEKMTYYCLPTKVDIYEPYNQGTKIYYLHNVAKGLHTK